MGTKIREDSTAAFTGPDVAQFIDRLCRRSSSHRQRCTEPLGVGHVRAHADSEERPQCQEGSGTRTSLVCHCLSQQSRLSEETDSFHGARGETRVDSHRERRIMSSFVLPRPTTARSSRYDSLQAPNVRKASLADSATDMGRVCSLRVYGDHFLFEQT